MEKTKKLTIIALTCIVLSLAVVAVASATDEYDWDYTYSTEEAAGFGAFAAMLGLMTCIIPLVALVIGILLCIWVYKDAKKRGGNEMLWVLVVLFTGIIGLIVWLVVRPPIGGKQNILNSSSSDRRCPNCGRSIPFDAKVCPYCGKNFDGFM